MKYLIVNADDLGADIDRDQGIAAAIDAGVVTSVSVLVNGPAFADALARLRAWQGRGISVGLHMNLSEGRPLCPGLTVLPDEDGSFRGKSSTHKLLIQKENYQLRREVALEIEAQISLLSTQAIRITHLDGHQHVHVFPAVIEAALQAAQRYGIPWLRIPDEPAAVPPGPGEKESPGEVIIGFDEVAAGKNPLPPPGGDEGGKELPAIRLGREAARFSRLGRAARPFLDGSGVGTTNHFRGLYLKGRLSLARLEVLLNDLPPGLTELMVHPGRAPAGPGSGPFAAFSNEDRERELEVLLDPMFRMALKEKGVILTSYAESRS